MWAGALLISTVGISYYVKETKSSLPIVGLYCVYYAIVQILAAKIYISPIAASVGVTLFLAGGSFVYPFTYQLTDTMNEFFGRKKTHEMIVIAFISQVVMTIFLYVNINLRPAPFWSEHQQAWAGFLWQGIRIIGASWVAFLVSENVDAWIYDKIRKALGKSNAKKIFMRNAGSDTISLALDSPIFVFLAFYSTMPMYALLTTMLGMYLIKWLFGVVDTPFFYLSRYIVYGSLHETGVWGKNKKRRR